MYFVFFDLNIFASYSYHLTIGINEWKPLTRCQKFPPCRAEIRYKSAGTVISVRNRAKEGETALKRAVWERFKTEVEEQGAIKQVLCAPVFIAKLKRVKTVSKRNAEQRKRKKERKVPPLARV